MHEKNKYRHIPWNRYNLEKYRDTDFWSYRPALSGSTDFQHTNILQNIFCVQQKKEIDVNDDIFFCIQNIRNVYRFGTTSGWENNAPV